MFLIFLKSSILIGQKSNLDHKTMAFQVFFTITHSKKKKIYIYIYIYTHTHHNPVSHTHKHYEIHLYLLYAMHSDIFSSFLLYVIFKKCQLQSPNWVHYLLVGHNLQFEKHHPKRQEGLWKISKVWFTNPLNLSFLLHFKILQNKRKPSLFSWK